MTVAMLAPTRHREFFEGGVICGQVMEEGADQGSMIFCQIFANVQVTKTRMHGARERERERDQVSGEPMATV